jgi:hypothetical protein
VKEKAEGFYASCQSCNNFVNAWSVLLSCVEALSFIQNFLQSDVSGLVFCVVLSDTLYNYRRHSTMEFPIDFVDVKNCVLRVGTRLVGYLLSL